MPSGIYFRMDPTERKPLPYERILRFVTPEGNGYLSFIVANGMVNISAFLCDPSVMINTTDGLVPARVLNGMPNTDCEGDPYGN